MTQTPSKSTKEELIEAALALIAIRHAEMNMHNQIRPRKAS